MRRIIAYLVETMDIVAVKALVANLHPGAERADRRKVLDGEADGFRGGSELARRVGDSQTALVSLSCQLPSSRRCALTARPLTTSPKEIPRQAERSEEEGCRIKDDFEGMRRSMIRHGSTMRAFEAG